MKAETIELETKSMLWARKRKKNILRNIQRREFKSEILGRVLHHYLEIE